MVFWSAFMKGSFGFGLHLVLGCFVEFARPRRPAMRHEVSDASTDFRNER